MIEEDVADHARVVAVIGNEHATERGDVWMGVREGVDSTVLRDSFANAGREPIVQRPFDEIAGEIADERFRRVAGKEQVCEVVHDEAGGVWRVGPPATRQMPPAIRYAA